MEPVVPMELMEWKIFIIRGQKVMLDADLADLYEEDFAFQLTPEEFTALRSQIVISKAPGS